MSVKDWCLHLVMDHHKIAELSNPMVSQNAATKNYVDGQGNLRMAKVGDTMTGNLSLGGNLVKYISLPVSDNDMKAYLN